MPTFTFLKVPLSRSDMYVQILPMYLFTQYSQKVPIALKNFPNAQTRNHIYIRLLSIINIGVFWRLFRRNSNGTAPCDPSRPNTTATQQVSTFTGIRNMR